MLGYCHPGSGVGVECLGSLPGRRGGESMIACKYRNPGTFLRERARREGEGSAARDGDIRETSSRLVVVGFGLCWIKHAPNAGTRQSINRSNRSEASPMSTAGPSYCDCKSRWRGGREGWVGVADTIEKSGLGLGVTPYRVIGRDHLPSTRLGTRGSCDPAPFTGWLLGPKLPDGRDPPACLPFHPCIETPIPRPQC